MVAKAWQGAMPDISPRSDTHQHVQGQCAGFMDASKSQVRDAMGHLFNVRGSGEIEGNVQGLPADVHVWCGQNPEHIHEQLLHDLWVLAFELLQGRQRLRDIADKDCAGCICTQSFKGLLLSFYDTVL